jgi:hypothetical protein
MNSVPVLKSHIFLCSISVVYEKFSRIGAE